jgi:hypothetical protein
MCLLPCLNCHLFTLLVESEDCALWGGEDSRDICWTCASQGRLMRGGLGTAAGWYEQGGRMAQINPVLRDPQGLDESW